MENNIKKFREQANLTQTELGEMVGHKKATVYRHESGRIGLSQKVINEYAEALGRNPSEILSNNLNNEIVARDTHSNDQLFISIIDAIDKVLAKKGEVEKFNSELKRQSAERIFENILEKYKESPSTDIDLAYVEWVLNDVFKINEQN